MTKPSIPLDYKTWAAPTAIALLLFSQTTGSTVPERQATLELTTGAVEYFIPKAYQFIMTEEKERSEEEIVCQFAQQIIQNTEEMSPEIYKILIENRKNLLL